MQRVQDSRTNERETTEKCDLRVQHGVLRHGRATGEKTKKKRTIQATPKLAIAPVLPQLNRGAVETPDSCEKRA